MGISSFSHRNPQPRDGASAITLAARVAMAHAVPFPEIAPDVQRSLLDSGRVKGLATWTSFKAMLAPLSPQSLCIRTANAFGDPRQLRQARKQRQTSYNSDLRLYKSLRAGLDYRYESGADPRRGLQGTPQVVDKPSDAGIPKQWMEQLELDNQKELGTRDSDTLRSLSVEPTAVQEKKRKDSGISGLSPKPQMSAVLKKPFFDEAVISEELDGGEKAANPGRKQFFDRPCPSIKADEAATSKQADWREKTWDPVPGQFFDWETQSSEATDLSPAPVVTFFRRHFEKFRQWVSKSR